MRNLANKVSIRQQSQELAGEAAVPCGVVGCCEVDERSFGLLFSCKAIFDVLCQQGDLVYGRPPMSEARLLLWEQGVEYCFDTSVDESYVVAVVKPWVNSGWIDGSWSLNRSRILKFVKFLDPDSKILEYEKSRCLKK